MRIYRNRLRPLPADPKAYNHAKELAKSWRKTGLTVDLVEYYAMPGESEPGGYVLTGRSNTTVISYRCQSWLYRRGFWGGRPLWTIEITVRLAYPEGRLCCGLEPGGCMVAGAGMDRRRLTLAGHVRRRARRHAEARQLVGPTGGP
jgi:hypothetical protein